MFEWHSETVLKLIELWKATPLLYDTRNKFYYNLDKRKEALQDIANKLKIFSPKIVVHDVKAKMIYLRGQYTRAICKQKLNADGEAMDNKKIFYHYKYLTFLKDYIHKKNIKRIKTSLEEDFEPSDSQDDSVSSPMPCKRFCSSSDQKITSSRDDIHFVATPHASREFIVPEEVEEVEEVVVPNHRVRAFCNYLKAELDALSDVNIKEEFIENITQSLLDAKRKQRMLKENVVVKYDY